MRGWAIAMILGAFVPLAALADETQKPPGQPLAPEKAASIGSIAWLLSEISYPVEPRFIGTMTIAPGGLIGADPLTWDESWTLPEIETPGGEAGFYVILDASTGRVSQSALVFSDAPVSCGEDKSYSGVDSGLSAYLDPTIRAAYAPSKKILEPDRDLYNGWFDGMIGEIWVIGHILPLPDGTPIPISSSGWGDGGYPVVALYGADGALVAVYTDFMGKDNGNNWLSPPACPGSS